MTPWTTRTTTAPGRADPTPRVSGQESAGETRPATAVPGKAGGKDRPRGKDKVEVKDKGAGAAAAEAAGAAAAEAEAEAAEEGRTAPRDGHPGARPS